MPLRHISMPRIAGALLLSGFAAAPALAFDAMDCTLTERCDLGACVSKLEVIGLEFDWVENEVAMSFENGATRQWDIWRDKSSYTDGAGQLYIDGPFDSAILLTLQTARDVQVQYYPGTAGVEETGTCTAREAI